MSEAPIDKAFVTNLTRRTVLAEHGKVLRDPLRMALGAMVRGLPGSLLFVWYRTGTIALTNWFVPVALDIVWLDDAGRVADLREDFRPWSWRTVNSKPARYVLELPAGTLARSGTRRGDMLRCSKHAWRARGPVPGWHTALVGTLGTRARSRRR